MNKDFVIERRLIGIMCIMFQQEEVSDDLLTFHEVVNHMQEMEEDIIDDHRSLIEVSHSLHGPCHRLHS